MVDEVSLFETKLFRCLKLRKLKMRVDRYGIGISGNFDGAYKHLLKEVKELQSAMRFPESKEGIRGELADISNICDIMNLMLGSSQQIEKKPILCLDFDGVIHSYTTEWKGIDIIPDPPVEGSFEFIRSLIEDGYFEVGIYSARSRNNDGLGAIQRWFIKYGGNDIVHNINFYKEKPPAFLTIDDRAIKFTGKFPTIYQLKGFRTWNDRGV